MTGVEVARAGTSWWGNLQVFGGTLYVTTIEPVGTACGSPTTAGCLVSYHVVPVDLRDPAHPTAGAPVGVPGIPFGASSQDPTTLYLSNYVWDSQRRLVNDVAVCKLSGGLCPQLGSVELGGTMGAAFVDGDKAFATITPYDWATTWQPGLHQIDLTQPAVARGPAGADAPPRRGVPSSRCRATRPSSRRAGARAGRMSIC